MISAALQQVPKATIMNENVRCKACRTRGYVAEYGAAAALASFSEGVLHGAGILPPKPTKFGFRLEMGRKKKVPASQCGLTL